jgi:hypothetical protein
MADPWRTATVTELQQDGILLIEEGNHGENRPRPGEFTDSGVAFIRAADMDAGRVLFESASKINEVARRRITKGIGAPGDVLLSHKGTVGKVALVPDDAPPFVCSPQTTFWRTLDEERLNRRYLYTSLRSRGFHDQLATRAGETDMAPYVSLTSQRGLSVALPPIETQRAISQILGTLDDKIELNRRMNETLEAMARALFKSWFVDFEPVRAKAERRDLKLDATLAASFPNALADSELGEIPEGWRVGSVDDDFNLTMGQSPPGETYNEIGEGVPFYQGRADFGFRHPRRRVYCTAPTRFAKTGDTLVSVRAPVGDINMAGEDCAIGRGVAAVRHKSGSRSYSYQFMGSIKNASSSSRPKEQSLDQFRSQYDFVDGFARHMRDALPNASFIGFTGTPIEKADANTRAVFGEYISVYDIQRAVADKATVPIYYESRLAKLELKASERPKIDPEFEEVTEGEEVDRKEKLKSKWAQLEVVVGSESRIKLIAKDLVQHFENRLSAMDGKAMVVAMSRRIAVALYNEIVALRPEWRSDEDGKGLLKIVMTGSASDPLDWQPHIRNKSRREDLAVRFRDADDPFKIVIVRDMWLTGFDAPSLHTMYVDKPMRGHGLMQAIARVNRVFKDKPGGLVVDYLGLADELRQALATYTDAGGTGRTALDQAEAVALMLGKHEVCSALFHGFNWSRWTTGTSAQKLSLLPAAQEHILKQDDGKNRLLRHVTELSQAFALAVPSDEALRIRDDVGFFQAVRAVLAKNAPGDRKSDEELDHAIRQIISNAVVSDEVVDIFAAAGLKKPDISILSDEFLAEIHAMPQRNLAVELLQKLLRGEIRNRSRRNVVQARSFADLLEQSLRRYQNRAIETAKVIEELIQLAKDMREAGRRGEELGLTDDEVAFYDALETNDSAVRVLGDDALRTIARELVATVRANVTIDWTVRENVRAQLRVLVKRILRKYGYPPDQQEKATQTVLEQAEVLSDAWALA